MLQSAWTRINETIEQASIQLPYSFRRIPPRALVSYGARRLDCYPIYHSKDEQIGAHLFLSILAFHVVHLVRSKLGAKQIHKSWATLKVKLNEYLRVMTTLSQNKTHVILLKQDQDLKPFQRQIFQAMGLKLGRNTQRIKAKRPKIEAAKT